MSKRVLVIDDEKNIRRTLTLVLESAEFSVRDAATGEAGLEMLADVEADLVLLDVGLPGMGGLEVLERIRASHPATVVVMISGHASVATAVEATRLGAFDFLEKPLSRDRVLLAARNALQLSDLDQQVQRQRVEQSLHQLVVGESPAIRSLLQQIAKVAPTSATVLMTGESGAGKEVFARALHEGSARSARPFVKVNCAAIPEELIETELFGCVKGAYTGADRNRDGRFQQAHTGTLFLDEIGDMSLRVQAKVLRALQGGEVERVGDPRIEKVDVRVLAATNKRLPDEVAAGRFREDLYFRLNVIPLEVPPLRERRDDIARLAEHFLALYAHDNQLPRKRLEPAAGVLLAAMPWRGNVRELRNVIERLAILSEGAVISASDVHTLGSLAALTPRGGRSDHAAPASGGPSLEAVRTAGGLVAARREFERQCISLALDATSGNVSHAAQLLGIERSNLHKKMQALGLEAHPQRPDRDPQEEDDS